MPTHAGPNITAANNLIFALDAADKKNSFLPSSTFLDMASWTLGSGGVGNYSQNGGTDENERVNGTDPWGNSAIVWESRPNGNGNDDGGWNTSWYSIDKTKLYRWSVWVKRTTSSAGGTSYLGLYGSGGTWGVERLDGGGNEGNPYWQCAGTSVYTQNQWYLLVGHCYPAGTVGVSGNKHPDTGRYTINGKDGDLNYCNIGGDVRWLGDSTIGLHRTYHYYCGDNTTRLQWYDPRFEICDGTEPTIQDLLRSPATYVRNLISNNKAQLLNGVVWSTVAGGTFNFDGTNDYLNVTNDSSLQIDDNITIELVGSFNSSNIGAVKVIANKYSGTGWELLLDSSGKFYLAGRNGDGTYYTSASNIVVANGSFYHLVVIKTGLLWQTYVNGILRSTTTANSVGSLSNSAAMEIGREGDGYYPNMRLSAFKVYNTVLTANQIKQNYNNYKSRFGLPDLI
jgi:hypothetical protein